MFNIENYIQRLIDLLKQEFRLRLIYVGLQGSYLRGEANADSDIDVMVVIDDLQMSDLDQYRAVIQSLECADRSCGFICGKADLANWNPLEIYHLLHSTKDYYGNLRQLVPVYNDRDIQKFVKLSLNNLYHELCHRYVHGNREDLYAALPGLYKGVFFILQNQYYLKHGKWIGTKQVLLQCVQGNDHAVLKRSVDLSRGAIFELSESFALLFNWCQEAMKTKY